MQKLTATIYMPDGSTKIFENVQNAEESNQGRSVTFLAVSENGGFKTVTINLENVIGFEIDGIIPVDMTDDEDSEEGEDD